eukprot:GEMP01017376.1.p1 GENE.GEMP01017376.1~~GEMP01017376.1.p1  ORF type:complete len:591 (+),score=111.64 GEMP01017376.1:97-1869(+)
MMTDDAEKPILGMNKLWASFSAPMPVAKKDVIICGTSIAHLLEAREMGYLPANSEWHFVYPERLMKNGGVLGRTTLPEVLCYIDVEKASAAGITFVLNADDEDFHLQMSSTGIDGIPFSAFRRVIDNRPQCRGAIRYLISDDPDMAHMSKKVLQNKKIWHATYWSHLSRIQQDGLLPNKGNEFGMALGDYVHLGMGESGVGTNFNGLTRRPDVILQIDPADLSDAIGLIPEQLDTVLVKGSVTPKAFLDAQPVVPAGMPQELKGQVVNFTEIPVIDFGGTESEILESMRFAISVGFMQAINHGIPQELCDQCLNLGRKFFALPQETKDRLRMTPGTGLRGYFGKGGENTDGLLDPESQGARGEIGEKRMDCKEGWDMKGCEGDGGGAKTAAGATLSAETPAWPEELPEMQSAMIEYQKHAGAFARRMLLFFGKALDLADPEVFVRSVEKPVATHRILHYWPLENLRKEISIGAHCDYGLLTVLLQDDTGGLQVLNNSRDWVHCPPIQGALVCNIGDMLARWTNNRCRSTIHRVVNIAPVDRYSMPFFLEPSFDTLIDPNTIGIPVTDEPKTCEEIVTDFYARAGLLTIAA